MEFKYKYRPAFFLSLRIVRYELDSIDTFFEQAKRSLRSEQKALEEIAASRGGDDLDDDRWVDDVAQLDEFGRLSSEFAIVGLWRCIELYRQMAMRIARSPQHKKFKSALLPLLKGGKNIRCARSVDELRCLNNAVKHGRRVNKQLASFPRWKNKKSDELGNLESITVDFVLWRNWYLEDMTKHLNAKV